MRSAHHIDPLEREKEKEEEEGLLLACIAENDAMSLCL